MVTIFPETVLDSARALIARCRAAGLTVATAESCTGGLLAACLTEIAGSSSVFDRGFVTYSNDAKMQMLGIEEALLIRHGAVSAPVVRAMAEAALARSGAQLAAAVTGVAGPGGGSAAKPVGLVHFAWAAAGRETLEDRRIFAGGRGAVRMASLRHALAGLRRLAG